MRTAIVCILAAVVIGELTEHQIEAIVGAAFLAMLVWPTRDTQ